MVVLPQSLLVAEMNIFLAMEKTLVERVGEFGDGNRQRHER
jgi:hypothetical protein